MSMRTISYGVRLPALAVAILFATVGVSHASLHYVIVVASTSRDYAVLDVASDQAPAVRYLIASTAIPSVLVNNGQVASSPDLIPLAGNLPALAFASTTSAPPDPRDVDVLSEAILRQKNRTLMVPPIEKVVGNAFSIPLNSLDSAATLYIASPGTNGIPTQIDVVPFPGAPPQTFSLGPSAVTSVQIPTGSQRVAVTSQPAPILVQLEVRTNSRTSMIIISPDGCSAPGCP